MELNVSKKLFPKNGQSMPKMAKNNSLLSVFPEVLSLLFSGFSVKWKFMLLMCLNIVYGSSHWAQLHFLMWLAKF